MTASLLAIDLATTRSNFGVLDDDGTYRLVHSADGQTVLPEPGGAIQEPDRLMRACIDGLKQCAAAIRCPAGLVLTGQMGGPIIVDERGAALTEWITAMDSKPRNARCGALKETLATLSAGAPDASRVERDRCVKLLDGNTWPMS
jgi:sugar (pentulose or hexulose) kinase